MKGVKLLLLSVCLLSVMTLASGCWDYREIEKLAIVSGIAIDKNDRKYTVTTEIIDIRGGKNPQISTKHITTEGISIFQAVRRVIKVTGKKLYFSHAEVVIIGQGAAEDGMIPVIDWFGRDTEPRYALHLIIAKESSAKDILNKQPIAAEILSYELNDIIDSAKNLSCAMDIEEWQFLNDMSEVGLSATLPVVKLKLENNRSTPEISGTAVFRKDKLIGFLDDEDTKTLMFTKNKIKGGLLTKIENREGSPTNISLEIFKNKTNVKPKYVNGKITMEIDTSTVVALGEIGGTGNYIDEEGRTKLKKDFEVMLEHNIKTLVEKVQQQYDCDIFGFGKKIKLSMPRLWKQISKKWDKEFKNLDVEVHSTITIKNSGLESKPKEVGD